MTLRSKQHRDKNSSQSSINASADTSLKSSSTRSSLSKRQTVSVLSQFYRLYKNPTMSDSACCANSISLKYREALNNAHLQFMINDLSLLDHFESEQDWTRFVQSKLEG
ncbi:hypothetical protein MP228_001746 [Amoeboaphelidium protococcarum]|nr:hypothetical protein MP228_001746 [Amoeboaphelidium protococcarum]